MCQYRIHRLLTRCRLVDQRVHCTGCRGVQTKLFHIPESCEELTDSFAPRVTRLSIPDLDTRNGGDCIQSRLLIIRLYTFIYSLQNGERGGQFLPSIRRDCGLAGRAPTKTCCRSPPSDRLQAVLGATSRSETLDSEPSRRRLSVSI